MTDSTINNTQISTSKLTGAQVRKRFLGFFEKRQHNVIPSASLIPENDPSVLFNTAGMQPLVPYLMGQSHPTGATRLANAQKCVRTNDIDEVGDNTHLTFFEMLGNWSLGDYFKEEAINWSYEFITSKEEGLGLNLNRLYVTVFEGDENAPKDTESYEIWKKIFESNGLDPEKRIFFMGAESNWWSPGDNGPCGPDTEMFYDVTGTLTEGLTKDEYIQADDDQKIVEIWNNVFMEYEKKDGKVVGKLQSKNVDTGSGLERVVAVVQGKDNIFDTDLFSGMFDVIDALSDMPNQENATASRRIIADHIRAATFLIADGAHPSNSDQGYIVRRLIRRAVRHADVLEMPQDSLKNLSEVVINEYGEHYPQLQEKKTLLLETISKEEQQFRKTLDKGIKHFEKLPEGEVSGHDAYMLFTTYGFPIELTTELAAQKGVAVDRATFDAEMKKHQDLSRKGAEQKFKGGLADSSEKVVEYHTATHLMLAGLRKELGKDIHQAGSNITAERLRFDFTHPEKVTREVLDRVELFVNDIIATDAQVTTEIMDKETARADESVEGSFWEKYPEKVTVYTITGPDGTVYSRELCGGPHVERTGAIEGVFRIKKEESSSAGVRRIKAVLD